jgi:hypothetical protein
MKKAKSEATDWLRSEYRRDKLGPIVRGKYAKRLAANSNVVVIDAAVAKVLPNDAAVNAALKGLLEVAQVSAKLTSPGKVVRKKMASTR